MTFSAVSEYIQVRRRVVGRIQHVQRSTKTDAACTTRDTQTTG